MFTRVENQVLNYDVPLGSGLAGSFDSFGYLVDSLSASALPPAWVEYFDSVDRLDSAVVDELLESLRKITDDKKRLLRLQLWTAMELYAEKRKPELENEKELLGAAIESLYSELSCQKESGDLEKVKAEIEKKEKRRRWIERKIYALSTLSARVAGCGNSFVFGVYNNESRKKQIKKLLSAKTCKNRLCPNCNARRAFRTSLLALVQIVSMANNGFAVCGQKNKKKRVEFKKGVATSFLTLTVENPKLENVNATFKKMKKALSILFSDSSAGKNSALKNDWIRKKILGALCCLEWFGDKTPQGQAHLHFHILLVHDGALPYSSQSKKYVQTIFARAWAKALGREGEWLSVEWHPTRSYERALKESKKNGAYVEMEKFQNVPDKKMKALFAMVLEVSKYAVTQAALEKINPKDIAVLYGQTEYCQQVEKYGVFRGFDFLDGESLESLLESVFPDYENLENGNWLLVAMVRFYWDFFENKFKAEFVDDFHKKLKAAPALELDALPPLAVSCSGSVDVPLG